MTARFVNTPTVRFSAAHGEKGGDVLVLPGSGGWRLTMGTLVSRLCAAGLHVHALDPPGQGLTTVLTGDFDYSVDSIASAITEYLDAESLDRVAVVGHSWGGGYALRLAQRHPERVTRLALLAPAGLHRHDPWEFRLLRLPRIGELAARFTAASSLRHLLRKSLANPDRLPEPEIVRDAARSLRTGPGAAQRRRDLLRVERAVDWTATTADLAAVRSPTLLLWGAEDRYYPPALMDEFASRLPHVEAHLVNAAGHSLHEDQPEAVSSMLHAWIVDAGQADREGPSTHTEN
jgi:4,5:9,10-diseco-3-hydroxy-5,9,17-trioxoandrosta-1(10),2-diene-4-oate hydrolase